jgi:glycosyltransferase involved in cell wall biosynthesis/tetratricopeptide (TPR) repeat protein
MATLSICLITKNEEAHLARCLESVRGLWDDLVVVDTGSTDRTVEIARAFGARLFEFTWQDDFSLARNFCIAQATGDWILSIDADESIAARDHAIIRDYLRQDDVDAVLSSQRHYVTHSVVVGWQPGPGGYEEGRPYPGFMDVRCRRLFRNRPWLRFRNRVHEELVSIDPAHPLREAPGDWVIHHYGKTDARAVLHAKGEAYLRIGLTKIEDEPGNPQAHYELAVQYGELGRPEDALARFEDVRKRWPKFKDTQLRIAMCHSHCGQQDKALAALRLAARELPQEAHLVAFEEGNAHRALGDNPAAAKAFERALARNPKFAPASVNLALTHQSTGRMTDALAALDRALKLAPRHTELRLARALMRKAAGDDAGALADLDELGTHGGAIRHKARILAQQRRFAEARECLAGLDDAASDAEVWSLRGAVALGLGAVDEAIAHLRRSLDVQGTHEAAINLSAALEGTGDRRGALGAAADALRFLPDKVALARFTRLAGDTLAKRSDPDRSDAFTVFFYQPHSIAFDGRTPRTRGLGGTESAIVYLAEALTGRGHRVVVLSNCDEPGVYHGVEYARWETMPSRAVADRPDVLVAVRDWQTIGQTRFAPLQIFWTGDAFDQPFVKTLANAQEREHVDFFMLQSDWHEDTFRTHHGVPGWQILRTRLGSAASASDVPAQKNPGGPRSRRLAYASTPFRGLDVLLDVFPRIRAACPDAELDVFSSMQVYGVSAADDQARYGALYAKATQPGVRLVGTVPQFELAERLKEARILAYPNSYAETFCIAAIEAEAAGCAVVTTQLGALPETVGDGGICIPGTPHDAGYQDAFVAACVRLLTDDDAWQAMSSRALDRAWGEYTWPAIAAAWETSLRAALTPEPAIVERLAVHLKAGRTGLAHKMLEREPSPAGVPADVWQALKMLIASHAGSRSALADADLRRVALYFRTLTRAGLIPAAEPALK